MLPRRADLLQNTIMFKKAFLSLTVALVVSLPAGAQPDKELFSRTSKGYELFDAGNYRAARYEFSKALEAVGVDTDAERQRIDYHIARCAAELSDRDAMALIGDFLSNYPGSVYENEMRFALGNIYYSILGVLQKNDRQISTSATAAIARLARDEYWRVDVYSLSTSRQDEYNFKLGHSLFLLDNMDAARKSFALVSRTGDYGQHAKYYTSYISYVGGDYRAAKAGFLELADNSAYSKVVPYYLLQIEFLEGNYDYVIKHGPSLMSAATGERVAEIARIVSEAYFHGGDYAEAIRYMERYRSEGGEMGRTENYLMGYSQYMRNDIGDAIASLAAAVGPDDKLTQNAAYHLGGCYLRAGDKTRAMQSFSMAAGAEYDPAIREDALFNYGKLQYELGGGVFNEAINTLNRYISEYPDSPRVGQAREYLVSAYYNSHNFEAAYKAIKQVKNPDNNLRTALQKITYFRALEHYNSGDIDKAYSMLEESYANRFNAKFTALTQFWKGEIRYDKGDYKGAIPLYKEYVNLSPQSEPEHKMALYNLGYSYFNQKQWGEAKTYFDRFLKAYTARDNYKADAWNRVGDAQYAGREFWKAIESYDAASAVGTNQKYYSQYSRAVTLGLVDRRERKIESLRAIINAAEGDYVDDAMYELGRTYISMEKFRDGAEILKRYVGDYPNGEQYLAALSDLGLVYQNLNDNKAALKYYQMVVDRAPSSQQARDAMLAVKSIYVDMNDVDGYFKFAAGSGVETDMGLVARDSLFYAAANRVYMTSSSTSAIGTALTDYLTKYPRGVYRAEALYSLADTYIKAQNDDKAIYALKELAAMPYNNRTISGLERLGSLGLSAGRNAEAMEAYAKLTQMAVNPETKAKAWAGYMRGAKADGRPAVLAEAADRVIAGSGVPANVMREAKYAKATQMNDAGNKTAALKIFRELATEVQSEEGAASTFYVIEAEHEAGRMASAEKMVMDFAQKNTPHSYWLGKSFLILGDIYIGQGDNFQARATLQSIVDGYSPSDDGVVAKARELIGRIGE